MLHIAANQATLLCAPHSGAPSDFGGHFGPIEALVALDYFSLSFTFHVVVVVVDVDVVVGYTRLMCISLVCTAIGHAKTTQNSKSSAIYFVCQCCSYI